MMFTGALGCLLACIALGVGQGLTLYTLSKFAERYDAHTYSVLVRAQRSASSVNLVRCSTRDRPEER